MAKNVIIIGTLLLCTIQYIVVAEESKKENQIHDASLIVRNNEAAPKTDVSSRVKRQDPYYNRRNRYYPFPFPVIFGGLGFPIGGYGGGYGRGGFGGRGFGGRGFGGRGIGGRAGGFGGHGGIGGGGHGGGGRG